MTLRRGLTVTLLAWLLLGAPVVTAQTLAESDIGRLWWGGNELRVDSTIDDPSAVRGGAPTTQRGLVKLSGDVLVGADRRQEVVLVQFKQTGDGVPDGRRGGEFYLGLAKPGFGTTDDAMHDALVVTYEGGFRFNLPIYAPNLGGGGGGDALVAGNFIFYQQGDGNVVSYELVQNVLCARWSIWTGLIPKHTAMAPCNQ